MPLATKTDTSPIKPPRLSKYEIEFNERHAASQAVCDKNRRDRNAPRRDDMARAAYYALLMFYEEAGTAADKAAFKQPFVNILVGAGYPPNVCDELFDGHVAALLEDLDGWLAQRWYAEGRRLNDGRGPYVPLPRTPPAGCKVNSIALTAFVDPLPSAVSR